MTDQLRLFLDSAFEARLEVDRLQRRVAELRARAEKTTTEISAAPKGSGSDREKLLALLADESGRVEERLQNFQRVYDEVQAFIDAVPGKPIWRVVLRLRYLDCLEWDSILYRLRESGVNYDERYVYTLHGEALSAARTLWDERKEN